MNIEHATAEDGPELLHLQRLAYVSEAELYQDYSIPPLLETLDGLLEEMRHHLFLKVHAEGRIIASVRARLAEKTCIIERLIVHPEFQKQGLGTQLMQELEASFPHAQRFELFTGHLSESNLRLYRKLGYIEFRRQTVTPKLIFVFLEKTSHKT